MAPPKSFPEAINGIRHTTNLSLLHFLGTVL